MTVLEVRRDEGSRLARYMGTEDTPVELVIHNTDGKIGKGRGSRSTYPRSSDPRRSKG